MTATLTVETNVNAPNASVWSAYTTPADIMRWNAASEDWHTTSATVDLRPGRLFSSRMEAEDGSYGFDFTGTYAKVAPQELLEYTFGGSSATDKSVQSPERVTVRVAFDAESTHPVEQQVQGWEAILWTSGILHASAAIITTKNTLGTRVNDGRNGVNFLLSKP